MNITVLNGSPKGEQSVTMQYVQFIRKKFPQHALKILHIAQRMKKLEHDEHAFREILDQIRSSDGVLWAFPLYYMLVHGSYKRFIELIWEREAQEAFQDKYAALLATSIHFYDHTAITYVHGICDDLRMKYIDAFSAEMYDLTKKDEQNKLMLFAEHLFETIEKNRLTFNTYLPIPDRQSEYTPGAVERTIDTGGKKILMITDAEHEGTNEWKMVEQVKKSFVQEVEVRNLNDLDIKGGCQGCIQCGYDNTCIWEGKDEFIEFYKTKVENADILIFAGTMKDRYLSSRWKTFWDRSFFYGHVPTLMGTQIGWILSGPLSQNANLRQILEAYTEFQMAHLVDIVTDECEDPAEIDARLQSLAANLIRFADTHYVMPATFLSVGGSKIFRDGIYGGMGAVFQADYAFYKEHGMFADLPQKQYKMRLIATVMRLMLKIPAFRKRFYTQEMKPGMLRPLQKVLNQV